MTDSSQSSRKERAQLDSPEAIERWRKALHDRYMNVDLVDSLCDLALKGLAVTNSETRLTDEQIMNAACEAADALDATRVSEMKGGGWHATTIFDGDTGLLRFGRLIEKAINGK